MTNLASPIVLADALRLVADALGDATLSGITKPYRDLADFAASPLASYEVYDPGDIIHIGARTYRAVEATAQAYDGVSDLGLKVVDITPTVAPAPPPVVSNATPFASPEHLFGADDFTYNGVNPGQIVYAKTDHSGILAYEVMLDTATDYHRQGSGGVKLNLLPGNEGSYNFAGLAHANGSDDCLPVLNKLMGPTATIFIPKQAGSYFFSDTIQIKHPVKIWGHGGGATGHDLAPVLQFPPEKYGAIIHRFNTIGEGIQDPPTTRGDGAQLHGLRLRGGGRDSGTHHAGIWLRARAFLSNMYVDQFPSHAYSVAATYRGPDNMEGNANSWFILNSKANQCGGHALWCEGADANAGVSIKFDGTNCKGGCIVDSSFLGNSHYGPHANNCGYENRHLCKYEGKQYIATVSATPEQLVANPPDQNGAWFEISTDRATIDWVPGLPAGTFNVSYSFASDNPNARTLYDAVWDTPDLDPDTWEYTGSMFSGGYSEINNLMAYYGGPAIAIGGHQPPIAWGSPIRKNSSGRFLWGTMEMGEAVVKTLNLGGYGGPYRINAGASGVIMNHLNSGKPENTVFEIPIDGSGPLEHKFNFSEFGIGGMPITHGTAPPADGTEFAVNTLIINRSADGPIGWKVTAGTVGSGNGGVVTEWGAGA